MNPRTLALCLSLLVASSTALAQDRSYEAKPLPSGKDAHLRVMFLKSWAEGRQKQLLQGYEKSPSRDPKWDKQAEFLLRAFPPVIVMASKNRALRDKMIRAGKDARKSGCTDPVVTQTLGMLLQDSGDAAGARPLLEEAWEAMFKGKHPAGERFFIAMRLRNLYRKAGNKKGADEFEQVLPGLLAHAVTEPSYKKGSQRWFLVNVAATWPTHAQRAAPLGRVLEEMSKLEGVDPWLHAIAQGLHAYDLGWVARGEGFVDTVTEEGWKKFHEHLTVATKHFTRAHQLRPDFPEAAAFMMKIRNADGGEPWEVRMWFDRAVAAEFDYPDAYSSLIWSLRPRWGGSHQAMYAFGKECLETARFDTRVPMWYWKSLRDIGGKGELENQVLWLKRRGVYDDLEKLFAHILASKQPKQNLSYWASVRVIVAYVAGKRDKAAEYYRALGEDFMMQAFAAYPSLDARRYKERFDKMLSK